MEAKSLIELVESLKLTWEKKKGLLFVIIAICSFYYYIAPKTFPNYKILEIYDVLLLVIVIGATIFWLVSTNRILINKPNNLGIYVSITCDEDFEHKAKSLFSSLIKEINSDKYLEMLRVDLLPINQFFDHTEIESWLDKQPGEYNAIIFLKIKNGKINSEEAINIQSATYTGFFKNNNLQIAGENLNILQDLTLRLKDKDWSYLEKNCLKDKEKFRNNLRDLILYYGGMFYLNERYFEQARVILRKLYIPEQSIVQAEIDSQDNTILNLELSMLQIQAGRLNYLLTNIYLQCVINRHRAEKTEEAIILLHEVEGFPIPSNIRLTVNINLAYLYYTVGKIPESKNYTARIHSINPKSFAYKINSGFYAIIENDPTALAQHYSAIDENGPIDSQPLEVIAFLADHQKKYPDSLILFEAAESILTKLFIEESDGNNKIKDIINKIPNSNNYKPLKRLCEKTLKKKWPKKLHRERSKLKPQVG